MVAAGIAGLVRASGTGAQCGRVAILLSIAEHDGLGLPPLCTEDGTQIARRWSRHGLTLVAFEPATTDGIAATGSSWAKRLGTGDGRGPGHTGRPVWRLDLRRAGNLASGQ